MLNLDGSIEKLGYLLRNTSIIDRLTASPEFDEPSLAELSKVVRDSRIRHTGCITDSTDAHLVCAKQAENLVSTLIPQQEKKLGRLLEIEGIRNVG